MSLLAAAPRAALWQDRAGDLHGQGMTPAAGASGFLDALERWWQAEAASGGTAGQATESSVPPSLVAPGWVLFLSYEVAGEIEPRLELPGTPLPWRAFALRTPCALVHLLDSDEVWAVAEDDAGAELTLVMAEARALAVAAGQDAAVAELRFEVREEDPARHLERVRRAQEYIHAGDIYQANLSRPWRVRATSGGLDAAALYEQLRQRNPAPFAALAQWQGVALLSSSPERLLRVRDGEVDTRPIAGTRPRTRTSPGDGAAASTMTASDLTYVQDSTRTDAHASRSDQAEAAALVAHPKERAEHIMLIDLERNDLGRVCEAGTVRVDEFMVTETYAHVHHIVSNVRGRLRPQMTPIGALRAAFPGGTITGVPKFRCMQIIAELEGEGRGAYTGSLGYLTREGQMDLNILIRTMTLQQGEVTLRAGGGIVADSDPQRELNETRAKARGMLRVFETSSP
jgi:anthranilate synthase component 1